MKIFKNKSEKTKIVLNKDKNTLESLVTLLNILDVVRLSLEIFVLMDFWGVFRFIDSAQ